MPQRMRMANARKPCQYRLQQEQTRLAQRTKSERPKPVDGANAPRRERGSPLKCGKKQMKRRPLSPATVLRHARKPIKGGNWRCPIACVSHARGMRRRPGKGSECTGRPTAPTTNLKGGHFWIRRPLAFGRPVNISIAHCGLVCAHRTG
jgi:hypothetical protein